MDRSSQSTKHRSQQELPQSRRPPPASVPQPGHVLSRAAAASEQSQTCRRQPASLAPPRGQRGSGAARLRPWGFRRCHVWLGCASLRHHPGQLLPAPARPPLCLTAHTGRGGTTSHGRHREHQLTAGRGAGSARSTSAWNFSLRIYGKEAPNSRAIETARIIKMVSWLIKRRGL